MTELVFFLEERSAKEMLKGLLPRLLPDNIYPRYVVFEGKQDLEKRLPVKLRNWFETNTLFVVIRDQDSGDCVEIKQALAQKCVNAGKPDVLVRITAMNLNPGILAICKQLKRQLEQTIFQPNKVSENIEIQTTCLTHFKY